MLTVRTFLWQEESRDKNHARKSGLQNSFRFKTKLLYSPLPSSHMKSHPPRTLKKNVPTCARLCRKQNTSSASLPKRGGPSSSGPFPPFLFSLSLPSKAVVKKKPSSSSPSAESATSEVF